MRMEDKVAALVRAQPTDDDGLLYTYKSKHGHVLRIFSDRLQIEVEGDVIDLAIGSIIQVKLDKDFKRGPEFSNIYIRSVSDDVTITVDTKTNGFLDITMMYRLLARIVASHNAAIRRQR